MLDRLLTTKYPLGIILMELAHQMKRRRLLLRARWLPRLQNQEADDLTNDEFRHFKLENRIQVDLRNLGFRVMEDLFKVGDAYLEELEHHRVETKRKAQEHRDAGGRKRLPLSVTDPWR